MPYKVMSVGLSDRGLVRENNEDVWGEVPDVRFYALADGMGGHRAGEVAAKEAVATLCNFIKKYVGKKKELPLEEARMAIRHAIEEANSVVFKMGSSEEQLMGMGTTLCCVLFIDKKVLYAHVGDSRIYRLRNKKLELLTNDHSLLRELIDLGQLGQYQIAEFLYKNILTRAIGTEPSVDPTINSADVMEGDLYLMCTDGLSDLLFREEIESILNKAKTTKEAVSQLVINAKEKGGYDNITAVLMKVIPPSS